MAGEWIQAISIWSCILLDCYLIPWHSLGSCQLALFWCRQHKTGRSDWYTRCLCYDSEGPWKAGEKSWQEDHEVQQEEVPSLAPGEKQPHIPAQNGAWPVLCRVTKKVPGVLAGKELVTSQKSVLMEKAASSMLCYIRKSNTIRLREAILPLYSAEGAQHLWTAASGSELTRTRKQF